MQLDLGIFQEGKFKMMKTNQLGSFTWIPGLVKLIYHCQLAELFYSLSRKSNLKNIKGHYIKYQKS